MRLFIALKTDLDKNKVFSFEKQLMRAYHNIKWVEKENLHLTLKFLGEVDEDNLHKVEDILKDISHDAGKFSFTYQGVSAFPNAKRARVIFIGVKDGESVVKLMKSIDSELSILGFKKEKSYVPHLTLGRAKIPVDITKQNVSFPPVSVVASGILIVKSTLTKYGPIYEEIAQFDLA
jgi:2'-5' RNA ligase